MRRAIISLSAMLLLCTTGCVIHDRSGAPEPIWWPTAVVRESTLSSSNGDLKVQVASPLLPPLNADPVAGREAVHPFVPQPQ